MSNPFQLTIPLKQHTPLIHFQHEQAGATLRATEVKPKLDKYLIEHAFDSDASKYARFLVGGKNAEHKALDYKLSVKSAVHPPEAIKRGDREMPMFFANMGNDYQERGLIWNDDISLCIHCLHLELRDLIANCVGEFLAATNFGMRSTKGFGSFTLATNAPAPANAYRFTVDSNDWKVVFRTIDLFYKSIRGGINGAIKPQDGRYVKGFYMKPMIFQYAHENQIKWEKKIIKEQNIFNGEVSRQKNDHEDKVEDPDNWPLWTNKPNGRIVRDLLGLSTEQTWKGYPGGQNGATITKEDISIDAKIDRFASPIIFKPIQVGPRFTVYFWALPIPAAYLNATFKIGVNNWEIGEFPIWDGFNINHFLSEYLTKEKLEKAMQYDHLDRRQSGIANLLLNIYSKLKITT